jgi:gluconolactonase
MGQPGWDPSSSVFSIVSAGEPWQQVGGDYGSITSLTSDAEGNVYFADAKAGTIERVDSAGGETHFIAPQHGTSIVRVAAKDRLVSYSRSGQKIVSSSATGIPVSQPSTITHNRASMEDFVVTQSGTIYFVGDSAPAIGMIDSSGHTRNALNGGDLAVGVVPAALALSPDQSMLVISNAVSRYGWSFQIAPDGSLANGEPFYRLEMPETTAWSLLGTQNGARGVAEDTSGNVYFATSLGIQIAMQNGRVMGILNPPDQAGGPLSAITFAGTGDSNWLYVVQGGKLYRRTVKVTGANAWTVVKPPKPTL